MEVEAQEQDYWCWAAVAASIGNFLNPNKHLTQGEVANLTLHGPNGPLGPKVDCEATPCECDFPFELDDALQAIGHLDKFHPNAILSFKKVQEVINQQLPIAARVEWHSGGAHFVVIDGYIKAASGERLVSVEDPYYDVPEFQRYEDFCNDYLYDGRWHDTYMVKR